VVVVRPSGAGGFTASDAVQFGIRVEIRNLGVSQLAVDGMRAAVRERWQSASPRFAYAAYFDLRIGKLVIETDASPEDLMDVVAGNEEYVDIRTSATISRSLDRFADTSPFRGGAALAGFHNAAGDVGVCTSSFPVFKAGVGHLVTAGHCFIKDTQVRASQYSQGGNVVGNVKYRDYPTYDAELIGNKLYAPHIYTGVIGNNGRTDKILGRFVGWVGQDYICFSGIKTGLACDYEFTGDDVEFCDSDGCTPHLNAYKGMPELKQGDSGGPFFLYWTHEGLTGALIHGNLAGLSCVIIFGCTYFAEPWQETFARWSLTQKCYSACIKPI
jgi:hypothetical protein